MYREHETSAKKGSVSTTQLVLPKNLREGVMEVAHDSILGGHLGGKKTLDRVTSNFLWPGVAGDVQIYVQSCDICQRTIPKGRNVKVQLGDMPTIGTLFEKVAIDLVGPLVMWILTMIDFATRYPIAIPMMSIERVDVAEALVSIFAGVGIPREILSDRGSQFTSDLMKEITRLLSIKQLTTTPYHAMCNGLVEKFNGTLTSMLKRMKHERPSSTCVRISRSTARKSQIFTI